MNTALVLSGEELSGLITSKGYDVSGPMRELLDIICIKTSDNYNIALTLQEKRLAQSDGDSITVEPLLKLIIEEVVAARSFHEVSPDSFAVECPNMYLHITRYEWAAGMWRVASFQDMPALLASLN